jgi:hypothetical protein
MRDRAKSIIVLLASYIEDLNRSLKENQDGHVRSMCAWALERLSGR